ncbi:hypothetical protein MKW94_000499 [Papaver nudicaule]|uniref:BHLH domain-containing protein n=1 Tax=Papaver nudicaule TaxID=74823 RepID=A0AA41RNE6_PAPNU|nr:hypothetical protein [Papaver nudicaule]
MAGNVTELLITENGNSFTALLGLPPNQAVELLHEQGSIQNQVISAVEFNDDMQIGKLNQSYHTNCSSMFNSSSDFVERASRFSIFAKNDEEMSATNFVVSSNSSELKKEPVDTDSNPDSSPSDSSIQNEIKKRSSTKRKEREKIKIKICGGKSKDKEIGEMEADCKKLPYVHVRARRGQATDSHSLAERARREKINARMKLLQELVPGCAKGNSGTVDPAGSISKGVSTIMRSVNNPARYIYLVELKKEPRCTFFLLGLVDIPLGCFWRSLIGGMLKRKSKSFILHPFQKDRLVSLRVSDGYVYINWLLSDCIHLSRRLIRWCSTISFLVD